MAQSFSEFLKNVQKPTDVATSGSEGGKPSGATGSFSEFYATKRSGQSVPATPAPAAPAPAQAAPAPTSTSTPTPTPRPAAATRPLPHPGQDRNDPKDQYYGGRLAEDTRQIANAAVDTLGLVPEGLAAIGTGLQAANVEGVKKFSEDEILRAQNQIAEAEDRLAFLGEDATEEDIARIQGIIAEANLIIGNNQAGLAAPEMNIPAAKDTPLYKSGGTLRDYVERAIGSSDPTDDSFARTIREGVGSALGYVGASLPAMLAGPAGFTVAGAGLGTTIAAGGQYNEAIDAGASEEVARKAALQKAPVGITEILPLGRALRLLPKGVGQKVAGPVTRFFTHILESAGEEAAQEGFDQFMSNVIAIRNEYDTNRGYFDQVPQNALVGGIVGGLFGGVGATVGGEKSSIDQPPMSRHSEPEEDSAADLPPPNADPNTAPTAPTAPKTPAIKDFSDLLDDDTGPNTPPPPPSEAVETATVFAETTAKQTPMGGDTGTAPTKGDFDAGTVIYHPKLGENGEQVIIQSPSKPQNMDIIEHFNEDVTFVPGYPTQPKSINNVPFTTYTPPKNWAGVKGTVKGLDEANPYTADINKQVASGVIIREPDGRYWVVKPTNNFGGKEMTFPKGRWDADLSLQENAIKETYEETGLQVEIQGFVGDVDGSTTRTRFYLGKRVGGTPHDMGWESQAVQLVTPETMLSGLGLTEEFAKKIDAAINQTYVSDKGYRYTNVPEAPMITDAELDRLEGFPDEDDLVDIADVEAFDEDFEPLNNKTPAPEVFFTAKKLTPMQRDLAELGYKYIGPKDGSVPGGWYQNVSSGKKYIIKDYPDSRQAQQEALAANLMQEFIQEADLSFMLAVPTSKVIQSPSVEGKFYFASEFIEGLEDFDLHNKGQISQAQLGFALQAWIANWDAIGLDYDNVMYNPKTGQVVYMDFGGALEYRAQGQKKGLKFSGSSVPEIDSLRDPKMNYQASRVYGGIKEEEIKKQVETLMYLYYGTGRLHQALENAKIGLHSDQLVLATKLHDRLGKLAKKYFPDSFVPGLQPKHSIINKNLVVALKEIGQPRYPVKPYKAVTTPPTKVLKIDLKKTPSIKTKFENVSSTYLSKIEAMAGNFSAFNDNLLNAYIQKHDMAKLILKEPLLFELMYDPNFQGWIKGNKIWWNADTGTMVWDDSLGKMSPEEMVEQKHLLPPILFHGSKNDMEPEFDLATGSWNIIEQWKAEKQGTGSKGADTQLGAFLTDSIHMAHKYAWEKGSKKDITSLSTMGKGKVQPFVVNLNPLIYDYKGNFWSSAKNLELAQYAKQNGYNGLLTLNVSDTNGKGTQVIVFDPDGGNLKSPYSVAFDKSSKFFLASKSKEPVPQSKHEAIGQDWDWVGLPTKEFERLRKELRRFGLDGIVDLKVFSNVDGEPPMGAYFQSTMKGLFIGLASKMPTHLTWDGEFHHEVIHALRYLGFFKTREGKLMWNILADEVKRAGGITKFVQDNYPVEVWVEEEIARLMSDYRNGIYKPEPKSFLEKTLRRMLDVWEAFKNWAKGRGFHTAEEVFDYITSGALANKSWLFEAETQKEQLDIASAFKVASQINPKKTGKKQVDYYTGLVKHGWTVVQLAKKNIHIPWLQEYVQRVSQWHNKKSQWLAEANVTVGRWNALPQAQQNGLAEAFYEIEHSVTYRDPTVVERGKLTPEELKILQKYGLTRETVELYLQVRSDFRKMLNEIERVTLQSLAHNMPNNPIGLMIEQAKAKKDFINLKKTPYFPHARFGQYTIVVKDSKGKTIYAEMFETEKARDKAVAGVEAKFPNNVVSSSKLSDQSQIYRGIPQSFLIAMRQNLSLSKEQQQALEEMIVHSGPAISFKNHFTKKNHVEGYSKDALRAYAEYFWHGSNHVARIEFGPLMEEAIAKGNQDIENLITKGVNTTRRREIADHITYHYNSIMNPKEDWAGIRAFGFMWHLAFHVKSAVMNFSQVPMVTYSHLASNFGDTKALPELTKAMKHVSSIFRSPQRAMAQLTPADAAMITKGIQDGFLDESFAAELAGIAEGSNLAKFGLAKTQARKMILMFNHVGGYMFQAVEKLNRRVTFMAAVELARKNPNAPYLQQVKQRFSLEYNDLINKSNFSPEEALAYLAGKDSVESTQFNYQSWARPRVMEGRKSAFLTFFMFTQNMLWFLGNSPGNTRYLLILLMFAGVQGLPGADDLQELVEAAGQKLFGKDWDIEREMREVIMEVMGPDGPAPDLFLHGISRYGFGLPQMADAIGLPLPNVDLSGNIGMGSPVPVLSPAIQALSSSMKGADWNDTVAKFTTEGVGASLGVPIAIAKAMADSQMDFQDPKRWEQAMPAAMSSLSKALRFYREGEERTRTGAQVAEFNAADPLHLGEMIAQAMGFRPTRLAQKWDKVIMQREAATFWEVRRGMIFDEWDRALTAKDKRAQAEVWKAVNRYNQSVPYREMRLSRDSLMRSRKMREKARAKFEAGLPNAKMMTGVYRDIERLYPELKTETYEEDAPSGR